MKSVEELLDYYTSFIRIDMGGDFQDPSNSMIFFYGGVRSLNESQKILNRAMSDLIKGRMVRSCSK